MTHLIRNGEPVLPPPECFDWITPDDAIRHALAAFYTASRYAEHGIKFWGPEGGHTRTEWLADFTDIFQLRVALQAKRAGADVHDETPTWLKGYTEPSLPCDEDETASPENTPQKEGQNSISDPSVRPDILNIGDTRKIHCRLHKKKIPSMKSTQQTSTA